MKILGLVLIALGVAGLYFGGIPYRTKEKVLDLGPIQATAERDRMIEIPRPVSIGVVVAGTVLLLIPARRRR